MTIKAKRLKKFLVLTLVTILAVTLSVALTRPQSAEAARLIKLSDTLSNTTVSQPSNHTIKFITPSGARDPSDTIRIRFPRGFRTRQVDYTDIDLSHGCTTGYENEENLAPFPSSTSWGASFSGRVLTLTHPTDDTSYIGDISPVARVVIEIGTHAMVGDDGDVNEQIINPYRPGTYVIRVGGTFGDWGRTAVRITRESDRSITSPNRRAVLPSIPTITSRR